MPNTTLIAFCNAAEGMGLKEPTVGPQFQNQGMQIKDPGA